MTSQIANEIADLIYRAGQTGASSVVVPGEKPLGFAEWVQSKIGAHPGSLEADLLGALKQARHYVSAVAKRTKEARIHDDLAFIDRVVARAEGQNDDGTQASTNEGLT